MAAIVESVIGRLLPRVIPRYISQAQRVSVKRLPLDAEEEEQVLTLKYAAAYTGRLGEFCELYAFCFNGTDVEALLSIISAGDEKYLFEITRLTVAQLEVVIDEVVRGTFPLLTAAEAESPSVGYIALVL